MMRIPIQIISTDFDGTIFSELEEPPVPHELERLLAALQSLGAAWIINTGRDLSSLTQTLNELRLSVVPDFVVTVEREIHQRAEGGFVGLEDWNRECQSAHAHLFRQVAGFLDEATDWIRSNSAATIFEDAYSPFCLIANDAEEADRIHQYLVEFVRRVPDLAVVRNDLYTRFSHRKFNKGSALGEITRRLGASREEVVAAGDHFNDLPMLTSQYARWLVAPGNAISAVREVVERQSGYVSHQPYGNGVVRGLEYVLEANEAFHLLLNLRSRCNKIS